MRMKYIFTHIRYQKYWCIEVGLHCLSHETLQKLGKHRACEMTKGTDEIIVYNKHIKVKHTAVKLSVVSSKKGNYVKTEYFCEQKQVSYRQ